MRSYMSVLGLLTVLCAFSTPAAAQAPSLSLVGLIGSGVDTGDADNNPYALQLGGAAELSVAGFVVGVRATRSIGTDSDDGRNVDDLRTIGGDLGFEWDLPIIHLGPRLGIGQVRERDDDGIKAPYLEPGMVADVELGLFVIGAEARYRIAINDVVANGFLVYARLGLRI
jgi:hypothetical protein